MFSFRKNEILDELEEDNLRITSQKSWFKMYVRRKEVQTGGLDPGYTEEMVILD